MLIHLKRNAWSHKFCCKFNIAIRTCSAMLAVLYSKGTASSRSFEKSIVSRLASLFTSMPVESFSSVSFEGLKQVWCLVRTNILTRGLPTINTRPVPTFQGENGDDQDEYRSQAQIPQRISENHFQNLTSEFHLYQHPPVPTFQGENVDDLDRQVIGEWRWI